MRAIALPQPPLRDAPTIELLFFSFERTAHALRYALVITYHTGPDKSVANLRIQSLPSEFLKLFPPVQLSIDLDWLPPVPFPLHPLDKH